MTQLEKVLLTNIVTGLLLISNDICFKTQLDFKDNICWSINLGVVSTLSTYGELIKHYCAVCTTFVMSRLKIYEGGELTTFEGR